MPRKKKYETYELSPRAMGLYDILLELRYNLDYSNLLSYLETSYSISKKITTDECKAFLIKFIIDKFSESAHSDILLYSFGILDGYENGTLKQRRTKYLIDSNYLKANKGKEYVPLTDMENKKQKNTIDNMDDQEKPLINILSNHIEQQNNLTNYIRTAWSKQINEKDKLIYPSPSYMPVEKLQNGTEKTLNEIYDKVSNDGQEDIIVTSSKLHREEIVRSKINGGIDALSQTKVVRNNVAVKLLGRLIIALALALSVGVVFLKWGYYSNAKISFQNNTIYMSVGDSYQLNPETTSHKLPLKYFSNNVDVATVDDKGVIHAVSFGEKEHTAVITAVAQNFATAEVTIIVR